MPTSGWLAVGAVVGALIAPGLGAAATLAAAAIAAFLAAAVALATGRVETRGRLGHVVLAFALGTAAIGLRMGLVGAPTGTRSGADAALPAGDGPWVATVLSVSAPLDGRQRAVLVLDPPAGLRAAASLPPYPEVSPLDRVALTGRLRAPPDGDYGRYLARIGVAATLEARELTSLPTAASPARALEDLRARSADALATALPEPEAGLAAGILIGLRDRVDRDLAAAFTTAGISHVVAISGWNITIVAGTIGALARRLGRRPRALLVLAAIGLYVLFVGASASVLRAAAMAGVAILARESGRPGRAAAALAWAIVTLLVVDPELVEDAGFRLSALATAGLVAWASPLAARLAGPAPSRLRRYLAESLGVSLAAQAATLPIVLAEFGRLSLVAPVVNLVVVPLVAPAMAAGVVALAAGWAALLGAPTIIATVLGLPAWGILGIVNAAARTGAGLPFASLELPDPIGGLAGVAAGGALVGGWSLRSRLPHRRVVHARPPRLARPTTGPRSRLPRVVAGALVSGIAAFVLAFVHRPDGVARIVVLDVGQGDAILVEGGAGGRLLVDGGPDPERLLVALDERLPPWDRRIDVVVLSHPHEDHVAGLAQLLERYRVDRVYEPGMFGPGPGYEAFDEALARLDLPRGTLARGDRLRVDDIALSVLWPERGRVPRLPPDDGTAINNVSIVLLGEVAGRRFLLTGDVEEEVDPALLTSGLPPIDVLKVAHHGSRTSSTDAVLEALRPAVAIVSAGTGNPYGHPSPATIRRLEQAGSRVLRTDRDGSVEVAFQLDRVTVQGSGGRTAVRGSSSPESTPVALGPAFSCGISALAAFEPSQPLPSAR